MIKNFVAVRHREPIWQWPWTRMKKESVGGRSAMPHPGAEKRKLFSQVQEQLSKPRITSNGFIYPNNIGDRAQVGRDKYCFIPSIKIPPKETKGNNKSSSWAPSNSAGSGRHLWPVSNFHFTAPQPPAFFTSCFMIYFQRYQTFFLPTKILSSCQISKQNTLSVSFHKIQFHFEKKKTLRAVSPVRKGGCPCSVESNPPLHGFKNTEIHHLFVWSKYTRNVSFPTDNDDTHTQANISSFLEIVLICTAQQTTTKRGEVNSRQMLWLFVLFSSSCWWAKKITRPFAAGRLLELEIGRRVDAEAARGVVVTRKEGIGRQKKKEKAKKLLRIESAAKSITIQKHFGPKYFVRSTCCAFSHPKKNSLAVKQLTSLPTNYKRERKILFNNI